MVRYLVISALLLGLSLCMAFYSDMFWTSAVVLPAWIYFGAKIVAASVRILRNKDRKRHLIILGSALAFVGGLFLVVLMSDQGLNALTRQREQALREIRPILLKYKDDHGSFPKTLDGLVPEYLPRIPDILVNAGQHDPYKRITYYLVDGKPVFLYRYVRGPDSRASYDVVADVFSRDK